MNFVIFVILIGSVYNNNHVKATNNINIVSEFDYIIYCSILQLIQKIYRIYQQ